MISVKTRKISSFTNQIPISVGTDGQPFGTNGILYNYRWNSSGGNSSSATQNCTGLIPVNAGDTVYLKNCGMGKSDSFRITAFNSSKTYLSYGQIGNSNFSNIGSDATFDSDGFLVSFVVKNTGYFTLTSANSGVQILNENSICTVNEPIN